MAEITEPMNLSVNGLSDTNLPVTNSKLPEVNTALSSSNDSSNQSPLISPVTSPSLNSRKFSFRSIPRDSAEFLSLALAVRSSNGRIQKALQQAQQRPGVSAEVANMTGADLQGMVKALCALIGCKRLDSSVLPDAVAQAVDAFLLQNQSGIIAGKAEGNTSLSADSMDLNGGTSLTIDPCITANPQNTTPVESSTPSGLCIETPQEAPSPGQSHLGTSFSPNQQGGHNGYYNQFAPQQALSRPQSVRSLTAEVTQLSQSSPNTPRVPLTLDEVYQQFWELAYRLFLYVCNPYRHCHECLCVVEDLVLLLENCSELRSPLPALALDSVIQRAMYELSDKVSRPLDQATLLALQHYHESLQSQASADATAGSNDSTSCTESAANGAISCSSLPTVHAPDCSVRNIEMCIALMSRNVSPICAKIRDDYYTAHGLPAPSVGQNWCEKVLTLTRQLQELIAWSSPHCQARVPAYVPIRRLPQSALAVKDTLFTDRSLTDSNPQPDAPQGSTTRPVVPSEPKVIDFISALSPTTASEVESTLKLKDAALCEVLRQMGAQSMYAKMPHDLESSIQLNLHKVIHQSISSDCSIVLTGAAVLSLSDAHNKVKLDYVALAAPYHANYHDLSLEEQRADVAKYNEIQDSLKELERAVETDKLTEIAWKHLKACARDFHTQSQDYIIKLTSNNNTNTNINNNNNMEQQQYGGRGYNAHHPHNNANMNPYEPYSNHNNHHHQHNKYVLQPPQYNSNFNNNSQYPGSPGNSTLPPELILEIAEDAEKMRKIGDNLVEKYFALRLERTAQAPVVNQILRKMEEVQESNDKNERDRMNFVRKFSKSLDRVLKDNRYLYVRMVSNKARFTHINFEQHVSPHVQVSVNVIGCNPLPVQMTELVQDYINLDTTNKVRDFLQTVKLFASSHHISDPASGYLSSTAWYVMALHVLLKHNLLPNLHHTRLFGAQKGKETVTPDTASVALTTTGNANQSTNNNNNTNNTSSMSLSARTLTPRAAYTPHTLPAEYRDRLHGTSLLVMLDLFFRYYVEQMNLFTSVVTLREQGLLLPKTEWPANPVLWRVSIEDPFEAIGSHKPYDLGSTLSRPGQLTTFKALRRAVYGIHSIMADTSNECHENISRLFSRVELINLARRSDYMGAVITASPAWVRPRDVSILDSPQYAAYTTSLCKKYEAPEALQGMFPALVSPRDAGNNAGMSPALQQHKVQSGAAPVTTTGGSLSARATEFQPSWMSASGSSAPSSARSAASSIKASPPMHQQGHGQGQYPQQPFQQGYKQGQGYANPSQPVNAAGGSYTYGQAGASNTASGPLKTPGLHLTQHPQAYQPQSASGAPQQGRVDPRDPRSRPGYVQGQSPSQGQYRDDPQMSYSNQQGPQGQQMPPQRMPYQGGGTVNLNNRQMVPVVPPQQHQQSPPGGAGGAQSGQNAHVHVPRHILLQQKKMQQQQAPPFDAAAAALAAAAERRYPVNQIMPSQNFDPKNRAHMQVEHPAQRAPVQATMLTTGAQPPIHHPQHQPQQKPQQQMPSQLSHDRFAHSSPPSRNDAARAYGMLDERHARQDPLMYQQEERNNVGNLAPRGQEGRYGADPRQMVPQTARQESHRFPMEDAHPSGSMSARYASQEDRYATYGAPQAPLQQPSRQQEQHQQLLQQEQLYHQQLQRAAEPAPARQPTGLAAGFKLDLQPRFAEDRYSYAPDSARSASVASSAYPSARNPEDRTMPGPVNIGNLSARRLSELSALNHSPRPGYADNHSMISPRLQLQQAQAQTQPTPLSLSLQSLQAQSSQSQKKSPVVPLIPLEGISNFSGSSGSDYSNSNPLYSDRSSLYLSTGRSDGLADTGRTLVNNNHLANAGYGPPGSSRSTGTQHHLSQYPSHQSSHNNIAGSNAYHQYSAPNTARSMDFALGPDLDSADDYGQDYFGSGLGHHLTARSLEESLQLTDRSPASDFANPSHGSDSLLTNRLGYMGLDDLRNSTKNELGLPLSMVRPTQASLLPLSGEFDDIFTRLNKNPLSNTQSMSVSQGSGRAGSFVNDLPLNSARSVNSANSARASSHASNLGPVDSFDFGGPSNNNNNLFGNNNSMGNMSNRSGSDLHSLYPARVPSITPVDLPGLLGLSGDTEMYAKTAHAAAPGPYAGLYSSPNSSGSTDFSGNSVVGVIPSVDAAHSAHMPATYE